MHPKSPAFSPNRLLAAILIGFAALSLAYSLATWLKYGPDEPAHFIYIRSIATTLSPPPISHEITGTEASVSSHEGHQPPLYYALMAVPYAVLNALGAPSDTIWRILRILSIGIGVFWIYRVYRLAREYFGSEAYALATAAFVALIPNAAYTGGVVNNEMLIALLFTWAMVPILRYFRTEILTPRDAAGLGLLVGLAVLSKAQGLILPAVLFVVCLAICRRHGYANTRRVLASAGITLGVAVLVSGWWFARCWLLYGTVMPHSLFSPVMPYGLASMVTIPLLALHTILLCSRNLYGYFWTPYWLLWKYVPWWHYFWPLLGLTAAVLVGFVMRLVRDGKDRASLWLLLFTTFLTWVLWVRYAMVVDSMANLQGRLFLSVAAIIGIVFVIGIDGWLPSARAKRAGVFVGIALMLIANAGVLACIVAFYAGGGV